jgi:hypothetical protein
VKQLNLDLTFIQKKRNNLHPFQTNVEHGDPSETLEGFHGQLVKHIYIAHALLNYLLNTTLIMEQKQLVM